MIAVRTAQEGDIAALCTLKDEPGYFKKCLEEQASGSRLVFIAAHDGRDGGYVIFNRKPRYSLYRKLEIPEIQDLFVAPDMRRQGVGAALIAYCEAQAQAENYSHIGISVGLHSGFGAAQRLYIQKGYVPDGYGVTYDREPVTSGVIRPIDDDLCLMMIKALA